MTPRIQALEAQIIDLKKQLSAARREAEPEPVRDYTLRTPAGEPVTLRSLFGDKRDLLVVHNMGQRCVYCTLWADGFIGLAPHLSDRAAFVLSSPDEPAVLQAFAASRSWPFRCVSTHGSTFTRDLGYATLREATPGNPSPPNQPNRESYLPGVSAFRLMDDGVIVRTGHTTFGPGDDFCALWPMIDLLHGGTSELGGRGKWSPKYAY